MREEVGEERSYIRSATTGGGRMEREHPRDWDWQRRSPRSPSTGRSEVDKARAVS